MPKLHLPLASFPSRKSMTAMFSVMSRSSTTFGDILRQNESLEPAFMAEGRFEMKLTGLFIPCGAISDCGTLLMYGGHMLVLVNLRDGQCTDLVPRLEGRPDSRVQCCAFSSSLERKSPTLAAATLDSQLLVFELIACATLATFEAPSPLLACAIAPRAQFGGAEVRAAAIDVGGSVLVWRLELQQSNASLRKPADAPLTEKPIRAAKLRPKTMQDVRSKRRRAAVPPSGKKTKPDLHMVGRGGRRPDGVRTKKQRRTACLRHAECVDVDDPMWCDDRQECRSCAMWTPGDVSASIDRKPPSTCSPTMARLRRAGLRVDELLRRLGAEQTAKLLRQAGHELNEWRDRDLRGLGNW